MIKFRLYPVSDADAIRPLLHPTIRSDSRRECSRSDCSIRGERIERQAVFPVELLVCEIECDVVADSFNVPVDPVLKWNRRPLAN